MGLGSGVQGDAGEPLDFRLQHRAVGGECHHHVVRSCSGGYVRVVGPVEDQLTRAFRTLGRARARGCSTGRPTNR